MPPPHCPGVREPTKQDMENAFRGYRQMKPNKFEMKLYKPFTCDDDHSHSFDLNMNDLLNQMMIMSLDRSNNLTIPTRNE